MKKKLLFLVFGLLTLAMHAQDVVLLNNNKILEGEIIRDGFGAITIQVDKDGKLETFQLLKDQIRSINYDHFQRRLSIGLFAGRTLTGARQSLADVFYENGFRRTGDVYLYNRRMLLALDAAFLLTPENDLGLMFMTQDHFRGNAYSDKGGMEFYFNNFSILPFYRRYFWSHRLSLRCGPSVNTIKFWAEDDYYYYSTGFGGDVTQTIPGLYFDGTIAILELKATSLKFFTSYHQLLGKVKVEEVVGTDYNGNTVQYLRAGTFKANQLSIGLSFAFKFK
jgi:hypothetical protein